MRLKRSWHRDSSVKKKVTSNFNNNYFIYLWWKEKRMINKFDFFFVGFIKEFKIFGNLYNDGVKEKKKKIAKDKDIFFKQKK